MPRFVAYALLTAAGLSTYGCREASNPAASTPVEAPAAVPASQPASQKKERPIIDVPPARSGAVRGINRSGIAYVETSSASCDGTQACSCVAPELFHGVNALTRVGVDRAALQNGTPCLLADFDGNGHTDAAFFGADASDPRAAVVLMHDAVGLSATHDLPKPVSAPRLERAAADKAAIVDGEVWFVLSGDRFRMGMRPQPAKPE